MVRPRGWHLLEKHLLVDGKPCAGSLFDFGLYLFHCGRRLLAQGGVALLLPPQARAPSRGAPLERRLREGAEGSRDPDGTIRATVLIETIMGAFQMDEILWELKDHSAGLNCGRWDYIFSFFIKRLGRLPGFLLPDRGLVTMEKHFLASYVTLLIRTCHRRGIHAMGGMAAQIPIKNDPAANEAALAKVRADKLREVKAGHDGTWVAHPGLVPIAKAIFDEDMPQPNQIATAMPTTTITAKDLLTVPEGPVTEKGLRQNLNVGILYLEAWLRGNGCVPLYNLMEDAATSEISRTQVWQWLKNRVTLADGRTLTPELYSQVFDEEVGAVRARLAEEGVGAGRYELAAQLFDRMIRSEELPEFLTLSAYEELLRVEKGG